MKITVTRLEDGRLALDFGQELPNRPGIRVILTDTDAHTLREIVGYALQDADIGDIVAMP